MKAIEGTERKEEIGNSNTQSLFLGTHDFSRPFGWFVPIKKVCCVCQRQTPDLSILILALPFLCLTPSFPLAFDFPFHPLPFGLIQFLPDLNRRHEPWSLDKVSRVSLKRLRRRVGGMKRMEEGRWECWSGARGTLKEARERGRRDGVCLHGSEWVARARDFEVTGYAQIAVTFAVEISFNFAGFHLVALTQHSSLRFSPGKGMEILKKTARVRISNDFVKLIPASLSDEWIYSKIWIFLQESSEGWDFIRISLSIPSHSFDSFSYSVFEGQSARIDVWGNCVEKRIREEKGEGIQNRTRLFPSFHFLPSNEGGFKSDFREVERIKISTFSFYSRLVLLHSKDSLLHLYFQSQSLHSPHFGTLSYLTELSPSPISLHTSSLPFVAILGNVVTLTELLSLLTCFANMCRCRKQSFYEWKFSEDQCQHRDFPLSLFHGDPVHMGLVC